MVEDDKPMVLFKHLRTMHRTREAPPSCTADKFTLENVAAYNIQIDIGDTKTSSIVTLREVPSFLIEAFSKFEQLEGCKVEGVFRKEGNSLRCKEDAMPVFYGAQRISSTFHVHDVCSWIKKFFRELQQPLFANRETKLIQFVNDLRGDILVGTLLSLLDRLPASHMGTLSYLMRCLQEIAESSHLHQMTVENLATVFAPSLFRGIQEKETKMSKKRNGSQEDLLRTLKRNNDLQVQVVKVLIENAEKIGASKDCRKGSRSVSEAKNKERMFISSSSLQRHAEAAKPPLAQPSGGAQMKINTVLLKKNSRSLSNLPREPSTSSFFSQRNSDYGNLRSPGNAKPKMSNSVVCMAFKSFKKSLTNLTSSDSFVSAPDPPGLANKKILKPTLHQQTSHPMEVYRSPLPTAQSAKRTLSKSPSRKPRPQVIPASPSDHKHFDSNVNDDTFDGTEKQMILNSTSNDQCICPEMGRPSIGQIQGTGVVTRRIQQFKKLTNTSSRPTYGNIPENNSSFGKPMGKPASHGLLWKKTNVTDSISEQPTKSQKFGTSRSKSVTTMFSSNQNVFDPLRPSVSATCQMSTSKTKKMP